MEWNLPIYNKTTSNFTYGYMNRWLNEFNIFNIIIEGYNFIFNVLLRKSLENKSIRMQEDILTRKYLEIYYYSKRGCNSKCVAG